MLEEMQEDHSEVTKESDVGACYTWHGVTEDAKYWLCNEINFLRLNVSLGKESRGSPGPQPHAANMRYMRWDDDLAAIAQAHADTCKYGHNHNRPRGVGENIAMSGTTGPQNKEDWSGKKLAKTEMMGWYNEVEDWSRYDVSSYPGKSVPVTGHYTQLIWAKADRFGCGVSSFGGYGDDGRWYNYVYLVCNFNTGNVVTTPVYKKGAPCSACPSGHCHAGGLCL